MGSGMAYSRQQESGLRFLMELSFRQVLSRRNVTLEVWVVINMPPGEKVLRMTPFGPMLHRFGRLVPEPINSLLCLSQFENPLGVRILPGDLFPQQLAPLGLSFL